MQNSISKLSLSKFYFTIKTKDQNYSQITKNVDVNSNIREMKYSMARITQNRRIGLFSLWSFNQSEAGKKKKKGCRNICLTKRKIFFMIAKA